MTLFEVSTLIFIVGMLIWFYRDYTEDIRCEVLKERITKLEEDDSYKLFIEAKNDLAHERARARQLSNDLKLTNRELGQTKLELTRIRKANRNAYHAGDI